MARSLKVGERLSRERTEAMDKKESLKHYVLGTMLVTLGLKRFQLSESVLWRPDGSLVRGAGKSLQRFGEAKRLQHLKWQLRQGRPSCH